MYVFASGLTGCTGIESRPSNVQQPDEQPKPVMKTGTGEVRSLGQ